MIREPSESPIEQAAKRLERAVLRLEQKASSGSGASLFDPDAARLAAELEQARIREGQLQEAGAAASEALGRAIAEIRAALGDTAPAEE